MIRIYLDTCMVIDLIEGETNRQTWLRSGIRGKWVVGSELLRLKSRIKAIRDDRQDYIEQYDAFFAHCQLAPFDRPLFECATYLRVQHRIKTPDALHLAAALQSGCEEFWTNDLRLVNAAQERIRVVTWNDTN